MRHLETTCHVLHIMCHVSGVACHFSSIPKPLLPTGSLLGGPGSLKRPKPLFGSLLGHFLFIKSLFSAKSCNGSLFCKVFLPFK